MATVKKCDICGEIFNMYPEGDEKCLDISVIKRSETARGIYGENKYDCCPKCTDEILRVIDVMTTYPHRWLIDITSEDI